MDNSEIKKLLRQIENLPGPKPIPILGNAHQIDRKKFHLSLEDWMHEYGNAYKFSIGKRQILVVSEHSVVSSLLRDRPEMLRRAGASSRAIEEMGVKGVFTAEGEEWRRQRKLVMKALTPEVVREFFPEMTRMTERLLQHWKNSIAFKRPINLFRDLKAFTLDITLAMALGEDLNTLMTNTSTLPSDIDSIFTRVGQRLSAPFPYWRYFKLPIDRAVDESAYRVREFVIELIKKAREKIKTNPPNQKPRNMLEALIVARDAEESEFTDENVLGNALTMVFAGEDTTSNSIAFLLDFIARNPEALKNLRSESDQILFSDSVIKEYSSLEKFTYIEAAAKESMRLSPVTPFLGLQANEDMIIGDIAVPKDTPVFAMLRHFGRSAEHFSRPNEFLPERWLGGDTGKDDNSSALHLFPFGAGPRFCPGRFLAIAEIKMIISMIVHNFDVKLNHNAPAVEEKFTFTVTPNTLPVQLIPR